jgi:hypothetical protein
MVRLENFPGFLLSYDRLKWWKSEALPGNVDSIIDVAWIYSEYHVCTALMVDGSYSIFQSYHKIDDSPGALHWRQVLNTVERIRCLIRPDYGRALIGTSTGWWRSENSGTTWTKVSTQAPNCFAIKEVSFSRLIAIDGNTVWWSSNAGTTWNRSFNGNGVTPLVAKTNYPTLDGTFSDFLVGCTSTNALRSYGQPPPPVTTGKLLYSDDGGENFFILATQCQWWTRDSSRDISTDVVTDIELSSVDAAGLSTVIVQSRMPNGLYRHYQMVRKLNQTSTYYTAVAKFDALSSLSNSLSSEEAQATGSTQVDHTIIFSGSTGTQPMMIVSTDTGTTWKQINAGSLEMYTGDDLTTRDTANNPFTDDTYFRYTWYHPFCHNSFRRVGGYFDRRQSYECDAILNISEKPAYAQYNSDFLVDGDSLISHRMGAAVVQDMFNIYAADVYIGQYKLSTYSIDLLAAKTLKITYRESGYITGPQGRSYTAGGLIVKSDFPILIIPQAFAVRFPAQSELGFPYDSRNEA